MRLAGAASSNSEARRLVDQGGVSLGTDAASLGVVRGSDTDVAVTVGTVLKVGKRRFFRCTVS